jgi:polyphenol oxidase
MYQAPLLTAFPGIVHAFSDVIDGNMDFRFGPHSEVTENRRKFLQSLGLSPRQCVQQQGLADGIHFVAEQDLGRGIFSIEDRVETNALITNQKQVGLFLCIADCLPIILYDPAKQVVALVHESRESTNLRLPQKLVAQLRDDFGCRPGDLQVVFGPAIKAASYIYDHRIYDKVGEDWIAYLREVGNGQVEVDNVGYARQQLLDTGVTKEHLFETPVDTYADKNYFSHVRSVKTGEPEGRFAAVVALR